MNVLTFIVENWDFILLIVAAVASVVYFVFKGNKSVVMKMLDALVTEAEKEFGGGTGSLKLASVVAEIYPKLPAVIKMFITEDILTEWIEDARDAAKEKWKQNAALAQYIGQPAEEQTEVDAMLSAFENDSYN